MEKEKSICSDYIGKKVLVRSIEAADLFRWHHTLTGSCETGRRDFCRSRGIDVDNDSFTLDEFIELTENAYGGGIIKKLKKQIKNKS